MSVWGRLTGRQVSGAGKNQTKRSSLARSFQRAEGGRGAALRTALPPSVKPEVRPSSPALSGHLTLTELLNSSHEPPVTQRRVTPPARAPHCGGGREGGTQRGRAHGLWVTCFTLEVVSPHWFLEEEPRLAARLALSSSCSEHRLAQTQISPRHSPSHNFQSPSGRSLTSLA